MSLFTTAFIGTVLSVIIIAIWGYIGMLTFALYSTSLTNHHQMRMFYTIAVLNIVQAFLGIYFILTGNAEWQSARWVAFSLMEIAYLSFVIGTFKVRWLELVIRTVFYVLVLITFVQYHVGLNLLVAGILMYLAYLNRESIISRYFPFVFGVYGLTSLVPVLIGFTTTGSLAIGLVFTIAFANGAKQLYDKEKIQDAINAQIESEVLDELGKKGR